MLHWECREGGDSVSSLLSLNTLFLSSPLLSSEAVRHKVESHSLVTKQPLSLNSIDVRGHSMVFGGDNEAFYVLYNVLI